MADTPRTNDKRQAEAANHPEWDRKQGMPKDKKAAQTVERASGRYSASEQSEEKQKSRGQLGRPRSPPDQRSPEKR